MNQSSSPDPLADYRRSARGNVLHYLILGMGLLFASMIFVIDECLRPPLGDWADAMARRFPQIAVERR